MTGTKQFLFSALCLEGYYQIQQMKTISFTFLIVCALFTGNKMLGQDEKYDKILIMIVNEDFEKALYKAESYTLKDATKKDPIPYLYCSMSYFEISKRNEFAEKYPKAFMDALKYAGKFRKKDTKNEFFPEHSEFFGDLRKEAHIQAEILNDQQKWTRSRAIYKGLVDLDANDPGAQLMQAYVLYKSKANRDGDLSAQAAKDAMKKNGTSGLGKEQVDFLKRAIITMADYLNGSGNKAKAKEWLELGHEHFKDDKEYMVTYNNLVG